MSSHKRTKTRLDKKYKEYAKTAMEKCSDFFKLLMRRLRLVKLNRNSLVFLIFLAISICFWFMQSLKETSTIMQDYQLKIVGVPKSVIFTSDVPRNIKVNISGKGYNLISYLSKYEDHVLTINYEDMDKNLGKLSADNSLIKRVLSKQLGNSLKLISTSPSQLDIYYTKGRPKSVPIKFVGNVKSGLQYVLCGIQLLTDSAQVYAPASLHDSLWYVSTEPLNLKDVEDTTVVRVALQKIEGAKIIPDSVDVKVCVDLFTEKTISVPIYSVNCPRNTVLRTFPRKADLTFRISANMYNQVDESDFILTVDFSKINQDDTKCKVELTDKPEGVSRVRFKPEQVEFVIEQSDE